MRFLYKIWTNAALNKKAEDLARLAGLYEKCLFLNEADWHKTVEAFKDVVADLNARYPRTKPFEVYGGHAKILNVCVAGTAHKDVVTICTMEVDNVLCDEGITPVALYFSPENDR